MTDVRVMAYVGIDPVCGHVIYAAVDTRLGGWTAEDMANELAQLLRDGFTVERMSVEQVREAKWCGESCPQRDVRRYPRRKAGAR